MMPGIDSTSFEAEVRAAGEALSPGRAGLLFARECAYPDLRPSGGLAQLDDLAARARARLPSQSDSLAQALALADWLFQREGFRGDTANYADPRNAYLNQVLERRLGLPISLSVVFMEVAQRLGLPAHGVGLPGHFIVAVPGEDAPIYLDPFHGGHAVSVDDCATLVRRSAGLDGPFDPQWLAPVSPRDVVARMLNNLRVFYATVEDWPLAIKIGECLSVLQPGVAGHLRDLGVLHYRSGAFRKASALFTEYLAREPSAPDVAVVRQGRDRLLDELSKLN
jgi:regulator of sirC expression with transglutaminase-like and TPR domain